MKEYDSEVAHPGNGINTPKTTALRPIWQFARDSFVGDISALLAGAIAPMMVLKSLIHFLASLSVAVFLYVFNKAQS
jgi:hypothetical protein